MKIIALIIAFALQLIGSPYVYGMAGPEAFDCSGFTYYCYMEAANIELPRTAYDQGYCDEYLKIETIKELKTGDLVFFNTNNDKDRCDHVGIYLGGDKFIHASSAGEKVMIASFEGTYYEGAFSWGRRIIED